MSEDGAPCARVEASAERVLAWVPMVPPSHGRTGRPSSSDAAPIGGAGGVVFNVASEVLVLGHQQGSWVFPKGHVEPGETLLQAALREVEEEAGVHATAPEPSRWWTTGYVNDRRQRRLITWFRLLTDDPEPVLREPQFPRGAFLTPTEALEQLSFDEDRSLLERMLAETAEGGT